MSVSTFLSTWFCDQKISDIITKFNLCLHFFLASSLDKETADDLFAKKPASDDKVPVSVESKTPDEPVSVQPTKVFLECMGGRTIFKTRALEPSFEVRMIQSF